MAVAALIKVSCGFPPQPLQEIAWILPQLGLDFFCPNSFQFIIYLSFYHFTLYTVNTAKCHKKLYARAPPSRTHTHTHTQECGMALYGSQNYENKCMSFTLL
jgi:hypothetical protein